VIKLLAVGLLAVGALASAPIQCKRDPDPNLRMEDTAGDALWDLSQKFKAEGNTDAARATLKYLVDKYPSSRHAGAAKEELAQLETAKKN
jgi:outer membrane protein assembly factor BamD (BamD/ComL family)